MKHGEIKTILSEIKTELKVIKSLLEELKKDNKPKYVPVYPLTTDDINTDEIAERIIYPHPDY